MLPPPVRSSFTALVRRGLRDNRRAPLTWGGGLGAMTALMAAIWPSVEDSIGKVVDEYPSGLKEAFGIDRLDTVEAYIDAEMLSLIVPLALGLFAVRCATRATVVAEDRHHLDTLLSLPISRRTLVAAAVAVTGLVLLEMLVVVWGMTMAAAGIAGSGLSGASLAAGLANVWPLAMAFAGLAALAAGFLHTPSTVTAVGGGTLVAMYVLDLVGKLAEPVEPLRALSAFRYYGSAVSDGLDPTHVGGLLAVGLLLTAAGAAAFERRDVL